MIRKLKVLHCLRAPVGGLFRHVVDLARAQSERGHAVGILCDASTGGAGAQAILAELAPRLALGLTRVPMGRGIGFGDVPAFRGATALCRRHGVDVLHGHGAKGGAYGRLAAAALAWQGRAVAAFYTPHGGSLHYEPGTLEGSIFLGLERQLGRLTDGLIFESAYSARIYSERVGKPVAAVRVIPNGLLTTDFRSHAPVPDAANFLFVGELRHLKGVDVLLDALAQVKAVRPVSAVIVGDGPDAAEFKARCAILGLDGDVTFAGAMPAARAFQSGCCLVVPSRAESFPYIVLEAAAARLPLVATAVGGIGEIVPADLGELVAPANVERLAARLHDALDRPEALRARAEQLQSFVRQQFTVERMTDAILSFYDDRLAARTRAAPEAATAVR